jgi:hypothetical protein
LIRCTPKGNQFQIDAMKRAFPTELAWM